MINICMSTVISMLLVSAAIFYFCGYTGDQYLRQLDDCDPNGAITCPYGGGFFSNGICGAAESTPPAVTLYNKRRRKFVFFLLASYSEGP